MFLSNIESLPALIQALFKMLGPAQGAIEPAQVALFIYRRRRIALLHNS